MKLDVPNGAALRTVQNEHCVVAASLIADCQGSLKGVPGLRPVSSCFPVDSADFDKPIVPAGFPVALIYLVGKRKGSPELASACGFVVAIEMIGCPVKSEKTVVWSGARAAYRCDEIPVVRGQNNAVPLLECSCLMLLQVGARRNLCCFIPRSRSAHSSIL